MRHETLLAVFAMLVEGVEDKGKGKGKDKCRKCWMVVGTIRSGKEEWGNRIPPAKP